MTICYYITLITGLAYQAITVKYRFSITVRYCLIITMATAAPFGVQCSPWEIKGGGLLCWESYFGFKHLITCMHPEIITQKWYGKMCIHVYMCILDREVVIHQESPNLKNTFYSFEFNIEYWLFCLYSSFSCSGYSLSL